MPELNEPPPYRADIDSMAAELQRTHGADALEIAVQTAKQHLSSTAWKSCAMWLQVVNRLSQPAFAGPH